MYLLVLHCLFQPNGCFATAKKESESTFREWLFDNFHNLLQKHFFYYFDSESKQEADNEQ